MTLLVEVPEGRSAEGFRSNLSNAVNYHLPDIALHFFVAEDGKSIGIELVA